MRPATYNLDLYRGDTYSWVFRLWTDNSHTTPIDLTDVTAKAEIRSKSGATPIATLTCTITLPNEIAVKLPVAVWTDLTYSQGRWDLQLTYLNGDIVTIVAGDVVITPDITDSTAVVLGAVAESTLPLIGGVR